MGLRFRRSWGVIPGVRFNLGLRSGSVSFGTRGLHYTVGTSGSRITAGIPGTGLFWTQKLSGPWGPGQAGAPQPPSYLPPGAGTQPMQLRQPQMFSPPYGHTAQPIQTASPQVPSSSLGGGSQLPLAAHKHVFVPLWIVWVTFSVVVIGGLCLTAATIGKAVH